MSDEKVSQQRAPTTYERNLPSLQRKILRDIREKSFSNKDGSVHYLFTQAGKYHKRGDFRESIILTQIITYLEPAHAQAHNLKIICYKTIKAYDEGIREYKEYIRKYPQHIDFKGYLDTLEEAKDEHELFRKGINRSIREATQLYKRNETEGIYAFNKIINIYHKAGRYNDELKAVLALRGLLEKSENWGEAIKVSNRYLQLNKGAVSAKDWASVETKYMDIFKDIFEFFSKLNDYEGYSVWSEEYQKIENKRFVTLHSDLISFYRGKALMRARKYSDAQTIFLNLYLNQPSSPFSKQAKKLYNGCKQAIQGVLIFSVTSQPGGADIYIDGLKRGKTPVKLQVPDKDFNIKIARDTYLPHESKVVANAAEGEFTIDVKLQTSYMTFSSSDRTFCPGVILQIGEMGSVRWHKDCFGLYTLEVEGEIMKLDKNKIQLKPGEYLVKACSFGEQYKKTDLFQEDTVEIKPDDTVSTVVKGAYIGDKKNPFSVSYK